MEEENKNKPTRITKGISMNLEQTAGAGDSQVDDHRRCRLLCGGSLRAIALTTQHHNGASLYSRLLRGVLMR